MDITIRQATEKDYQAVEHLMEQVQQLHVDWRPDIYQSVNPVIPEALFRQMLKEEIVLTAQIGSQVCGIMILLKRVVSSPTQVKRRILFIDSLAVEESSRGHGIGTALLHYACRLAGDGAYDGLELQVNARNIQAKRLYEKLGFTEKSINMEFLGAFPKTISEMVPDSLSDSLL